MAPSRPEPILARHGTPIVCFGCGKEIYLLARHVRNGEAVMASDFVPARLKYKSPVDGEIPTCPSCGAMWLADFMYRVTRGDFTSTVSAGDDLDCGFEVDIMTGARIA